MIRKLIFAIAALCAAFFLVMVRPWDSVPHPAGDQSPDPIPFDVVLAVEDPTGNQYEPVAEPEPELEPEPEPAPDPMDKKIAGMTLYEKVGQLFVVRMPYLPRAKRLVEEYHIGGFIFFGNNVESIGQVQQTIADLQELSAIPLFIAVDEEGGRVSRIGRLFPQNSPSAFSIGNTGDTQAAFDAYYNIGNQLSYLGFNMNFAPVADIWTNPANTVIGDRAFGTEPYLVADMTAAAVKGTQKAGIMSVIKHFPGHGDTIEDSHYRMAFYHHDRARFEAVEAIPFRRGIEAGTDGLMIGHISAPELCPNEDKLSIATFSGYLMEEVRNWGFDGLIITDALDMHGLTNYFSDEEIVIGAFMAGADILLMPANPERAINILINAYRNGDIDAGQFHNRLDESLRRILLAKERVYCE